LVVKLCEYNVRFNFKIINFFVVSQDPGNYNDAPTEGIRRVLEIVTDRKIPRTSVLETEKIGALSSYHLESI
jgi:hypothetical protein